MDFNLTVDELGELTFKQFSALVKRKNNQEKVTDYRNMTLVATILNSRQGIKRHQMVTVEDLMGNKERQVIKSADEQMLEVMKIMKVFNGVDKRGEK